MAWSVFTQYLAIPNNMLSTKFPIQLSTYLYAQNWEARKWSQEKLMPADKTRHKGLDSKAFIFSPDSNKSCEILSP